MTIQLNLVSLLSGRDRNIGILSPQLTQNILQTWQVGQLIEGKITSVHGQQIQIDTGKIQLVLEINHPVPINLGEKIILELQSNLGQLSFKWIENPLPSPLQSWTKELLPKQIPYQTLISTLLSVAHEQTDCVMPLSVQQAAMKFLQQLPTASSLQQPKSLQEAIAQSGIFLEKSMQAAIASQETKPALTQDLKTQLMKLVASLQEEPHVSSPLEVEKTPPIQMRDVPSSPSPVTSPVSQTPSPPTSVASKTTPPSPTSPLLSSSQPIEKSITPVDTEPMKTTVTTVDTKPLKKDPTPPSNVAFNSERSTLLSPLNPKASHTFSSVHIDPNFPHPEEMLLAALNENSQPAPSKDFAQKQSEKLTPSEISLIPFLKGELSPPSDPVVASFLQFHSTKEAIQQLLTQAMGTLSHLQITQLSSLPSNNPSAPLQWVFELPVVDNKECHFFQFAIQKDQENETSTQEIQHVWTVKLSFSLSALGAVQMRLQLKQNMIRADVWSEKPTTKTLFESQEEILRKSLAEEGIHLGTWNCHENLQTPSSNPNPLIPPLLDIRI